MKPWAGNAWTFDVTAITAPTTVLHREADALVPIAHGRHTADIIPGATFVPLPDHGHVSTMTELPQPCADLVASLR
jgi:pimeloyl-ACP methyl ester carboxylesterase